MPLKPREIQGNPPEAFDSLEEAFLHFLMTWYQSPETPETFKEDTAQVHHAFMFGAWYMKRLVQKSQSLTPQEMHQHIARLYKELQQSLAAARPIEPRRVQSPHFQPPQPSGQRQVPPEGTEPTPMTWTVTMLREFELAHQQARQRGDHTFPFKDKVFRTVDAASIIQHLRGVFAPEQKIVKPTEIRPQP